MLIYPAVDLYQGKAVRLLKGDYNQMTIYSEDPPSIAEIFRDCGAEQMHIVDLEGARDGNTPNLETILAIKKRAGLFCEVGGGIRNMEVVKRYLGSGIDRVILGTAAITDPDFLEQAAAGFAGQIAVGLDLKDGYAAIRGWTEKSSVSADDMCRRLQELGITTMICTDISRDGAMQGTNHELYRRLSESYKLNIIASGGVSGMEDIRRLRAADMYGAIIGKAYYTGAIDLREAVEAAR